ncbi:hypothetical protein AVEN_73028-1 [Araneus ventricosus]|uniref:Uncharacterized protein n=1 Tax=Araneus ventricosus TaxID=182803 RepID=A0A4Y2SWM2_ARAVE|nr:hypothetical protein AVEN_73028-1 [Araneus ventricosus]
MHNVGRREEPRKQKNKEIDGSNGTTWPRIEQKKTDEQRNRLAVMGQRSHQRRAKNRKNKEIADWQNGQRARRED